MKLILVKHVERCRCFKDVHFVSALPGAQESAIREISQSGVTPR